MTSTGFCPRLRDPGLVYRKPTSQPNEHLVTIYYKTPDSGLSTAAKWIARESGKKYATEVLLFKDLFNWSGKNYFKILSWRNEWSAFKKNRTGGLQMEFGYPRPCVHSRVCCVFQRRLGTPWITPDVSPRSAYEVSVSRDPTNHGPRRGFSWLIVTNLLGLEMQFLKY